jgi:hypothetical protein
MRICPPRTRFWSEGEKLGYACLAFDIRLWIVEMAILNNLTAYILYHI